MTLALLIMAVGGAWAQTETLLTTITATGTEQASYSTANVATVSFSNLPNNSSHYTDTWGWWGYGFTATVTAAEGYTITKCVFYDNDGASATDSTDPFIVETEEQNKKPKVNGATFGAFTSAGIKMIEVYGYVTPTAPTEPDVEVTTNAASEQDLFTEASFTMPTSDVTVNYMLVRDMQDETNPVVFSGLPSSGKIIVKKGSDGKYQPAEALNLQLIDPLAAAEAQNIIAADGITVKVLVGAENEQGAIDYDQDNPITLDAFLADMKPGYYWIKAESTDENSPYDGTVYSSEFTVVEQYDLTVKPANDFSKNGLDAVTVGSESVTLDAATGKATVTNVAPGAEVKLKAKRGYVIESVEAKKPGPVVPQLDNTMTAWSAGTFAVPAGGLTYSDAITVTGDVTLTLTDGETLTLNKGISIADGATLTIQGNGAMVVNGTNNSTASTVAGSTGTLILTSGTLTARGGNGGSVGDYSDRCTAGTGGDAISGTLTINGGSTSVNDGSNGSVGIDCNYCTAGTGGKGHN